MKYARQVKQKINSHWVSVVLSMLVHCMLASSIVHVWNVSSVRQNLQCAHFMG